MSAAAALAIRDEIDGQCSGYWLDRDHDPQAAPPSYRPTGAVLRRLNETNQDEFVCLDLVLVEAPGGFVWLPLSEAGRYTYAHSLGPLQNESWRLAVWDRSTVRVYQAQYAESLLPEQIASQYGAEAQERARPDRPAVQLRLRLVGA